jgi:hypothetical protein
MDKTPDIDLVKRKNIIREELSKLLGEPVEKKSRIEEKRIKQMKFDRKKTRRIIANASRRKNR